MIYPKNLPSVETKFISDFPGRPTIVFLHDSLGCIELWRDFPEKLGAFAKCNVVIYDRIGYGKSPFFVTPRRENDYMELEADFLIQLLDQWQIKSPILFGHSDGGSIALIAAGKYPAKIKGVITEGAHVFVEEITINGILEAVELYSKTNLKAKLEKYHGDKTDEMFWAWASTWTTEKFRSWNIESFLPTITCPSLIIQGEEDEYGTLEQVTSIVEKTNGLSDKLILPHVKHTPHKEVPERILNASKEFIRTLI
jgi:pimeloyl-ACP methyl ester carboxylesterase